MKVIGKHVTRRNTEGRKGWKAVAWQR